MKHGLCVVLICFCLGCQPKASEGKVLARVGDYIITQEDFDYAYKHSSHAQGESLAAKQDFLNNMINQKLILMDAQKQGLDKDKEFLKMVESFWQQSLLTRSLEEKSKQGVNLDQWVDELKKNTSIVINQELLNE